ncbi:MAG: glycosyltransferase family 2 protein [Thiohalospira sp.]
MILLEGLFWLAVAGVVYTYALYPGVLVILAAGRQVAGDLRFITGKGERRAPTLGPEPPPVTVIIAAFNEAGSIGPRLRNLLAQEYPGAVRILVGSDASGDGTVAEARSVEDPRVEVIDFRERRGKAAVLNDLVSRVEGGILVMTDANTRFEPGSLARLVRHFADPAVGAVCGELHLEGNDGSNQDGLYWRYEQVLKFYESRIGGLLGANGAIYALRHDAFRALPAGTIVDDFHTAMVAAEAGWRVVYDPEARAVEETPEALADEFRRRVRIGVGNWQSFARFIGMLHPRYGARAFTFLSHKALRWLVPHLALVALATSIALAASGDGLYIGLLVLQLLGYGWAAGGWLWLAAGRRLPGMARAPISLAAMNVALFLGFLRWLVGGSGGAWNRTRRNTEAT